MAVDSQHPDADDAALLGAVQAALNRAASDLDGDTRMALDRARRRAVAVARTGPRARGRRVVGRWPTWGLVTAMAMGMMVLVWWPGQKSLPDGVMDPGAMVADVALLSASEGMDFYADLDFYMWLAEQGEAG